MTILTTVRMRLEPINDSHLQGLHQVNRDPEVMRYITGRGDTLEDTVTYISEPEHIERHIDELDRLSTFPIEKILPNHGAPDRIAEGGYDKRTQGVDMARVLDALGLGRVDLVTHDIGNMVGYAFAAQYPERVTRFVLMDAPIPGVGPWDEILRSPLLWHFRFGGPDMERLVAGRERIYLDRFWNEFSADPARFDEASREHYARLYAQPGAMRAGFAQFLAFDQDTLDNRALLARGQLTMPVLAIGGAASLGPVMGAVARGAATNVEELIIPGSGHWLMEEQPEATVAAIRAFLARH